MTREEMIAKAKETRKQVMNAVVSQELLDQYPAMVTRMVLNTKVGEVAVYDTVPAHDIVLKEKRPLIINLHGGGFIRERTQNDEIFCRRIAGALECHVLDVDYSIAPDYPFPQALSESYEVVKWAISHAENFGSLSDNLVLMGHSAGGNLVCGINMLGKENGEVSPKMNIIDYPPLDLYTDPGKKKTMGKGIPAERARLYNLYYADEEQLKNPLVSPYYASDAQLAGFAPTLLMTAGTDDLCNEAEEFGLHLARCGVEVTMKRFRGAKHGFTIYRTTGCDEAVAMIVKFIKDHIGE